MTTSSIETVAHGDYLNPATRLEKERRFYLIAAGLTLLVSVVGFRNFYFGGHGFGGHPLTPQIVPVIYVHAFVLSSWVVLFLAQNVLIYTGRIALHMTLGYIGAALAVAVVIMGATIGILSAHYNTEAYVMFGGSRFFLVEMLTQILLFGVLTAAGIVYRRRAELHRPLMLMATVVIMAGAIARCPLFDVLAATPPLYAYAPVLLFGLFLLVVHWVITRTVNRWGALILAGVCLVFLVSLPLGHSEFWQQMVSGYIP